MRFVIAGGGTGGHLFPGIAMAEELVARNSENQVLFVGTKRGIEAREVPKAGFRLELIDVTGLKGKGVGARLAGMSKLPWALLRSLRILRRFRPKVVLGVGGYASGPVLLAARLLRIPTAILEQNAAPGITNRILGKVVRLVFTAFPEAGGFFPARKVRQLGNPIRRSLLDNFLKPHPRDEQDRFSLLVIGGSQGAHAINLILPEAIECLPAALSARTRILHQTGARDRASVAQRYAELEHSRDAAPKVEVVDFISDMSAAYGWASLVVARAGASTLAELTVCRRASILIPFAAAADDHQTKNAAALAQSGAAVVIREADLTADRLAQEIGTLAQAPERIALMEQASARLGRPEAAREIGEVLSQLAVGAPNPGQRASPTRPVED